MRLSIKAAFICALSALFPAIAGAAVFGFTGNTQTFTILTSGLYSFTVAGAQGGKSAGSFPATTGGFGAVMIGNHFFDAGTLLQVVVGGQGANGPSATGSGGGGASFVFELSGINPLIVAGGGGGGGFTNPDGSGIPGQTGVNGSNGQHESSNGGINGSGGGRGTRGSFDGGGGAGWLGNGGGPDSSGGSGGFGPLTFAGGAGGGGGGAGGFGGGGGGGTTGAGGGGGYSGGGGASGNGGYGGGGGGSFFDPAFFNTTTAPIQSGNGSVAITFVMAPEPSSITMISAAYGLLSLSGRRRHRVP